MLAGGGDKAEPMYEALQEALEQFDYINEKRLVVVLQMHLPKL